ncbi:MAG: ATP-binding protein [Polyangiales bacterium]
MLEAQSSLERRVLVLMPTRKDAERTVALLAEVGIEASSCGDTTELCREQRLGVGAILLTDDALLADATGQLAEAMREQPAWSNVPFVVLARDGSNEYLGRAISDAFGNLTVIERPVRTRFLLSAVHSALRGRQHQYQIRDALRQREQQTQELLVQEERARFALAAGGLGSWDLDLHSMDMECSQLCKLNYGRPLDQPFTYAQLHESIHVEDRERVREAIESALTTGADYDVEYRCCWPNGETHWVMVRGRVAYDGAGRPQRMAGVSLDISERKAMYEALQESQAELVRQAEQLRDADRRKDEFLATLAHELRNPLAPIRTGMDLLAVSDPESQRTMDVIRRQLGHMVRLIDDLLDVSRITRGKLELRRAPVTLQEVATTAVESSRSVIDRGGHTLRVALPSEPLWLDADLTRLAQVLGNLLNNASKYTPAGGNLELSARREQTSVVITVRDDGIGIPADQLEHVFEMFGQVNRTLDRAQGGLGIGLALVRQLVELHGGTVAASSEGDHAGTLIEVRLPLAREQQAAQPAVEPRTDATPRRVLVVDDNEDAAEMIVRALQRAGHETAVAYDGPSALAEVERWKPQVVLLDIGLPGMSGYDVARQLRQHAEHGGLALIALTGWGSHDDRQKANDAGFDLHLTKPVDAAQLRQALASVRR